MNRNRCGNQFGRKRDRAHQYWILSFPQKSGGPHLHPERLLEDRLKTFAVSLADLCPVTIA